MCAQGEHAAARYDWSTFRTGRKNMHTSDEVTHRLTDSADAGIRLRTSFGSPCAHVLMSACAHAQHAIRKAFTYITHADRMYDVIDVELLKRSARLGDHRAANGDWLAYTSTYLSLVRERERENAREAAAYRH